MIKIKSHINDDILLKHSKFIVDSCGMQESLEDLKVNIKSKINSDYLNKLSEKNEDMTPSELIACMCKFIDILIGEVIDLKQVIEVSDANKFKNSSNLFIAEPKLLNEKINRFNTEYPLAIKIIKDDGSLNSYKNSFSNLIFKTLKYDKFSLKSSDILDYKKFLNNLKSPSSKFYENIKQDEKQLGRIKKTICNDIQKYSITDELRQIHDKIIGEIDSIVEINIGQTISEVSSIIKNSFEPCLDLYEKMDFTASLYDNFIFNSKDTTWNAYKLVMAMGTRSCPYCNRQYITPVYSEKNGSIRADLDHFFAKSLYPYLSISIYNLIPCCKFCNSSLKSSINFNYDSYLHPYECGFEDYLKFRFKPTEYTLSGLKNSELRIVVEATSANDTYCQSIKAQNNANIFKIEPLYNYHRDEVRDLIRKRLVYSDEYFKEIERRLKDILGRHVSKQELVEFIISRTIDTDRMHEQTLSKLYSDITEQLKFFGENKDKSESILSNSDLEELKRLVN